MHKLSKVIGDNVERLRKSQGLTQPDFGAKCKPVISQSRLSQIENGEKMITVKTIEQLAKALGVRPFELLLDLNEAKPELSTLLEKISLLSKKEREPLLKMIEAVLKVNGLT